MSGSFLRRLTTASAVAVTMAAGAARPAAAQNQLNLVGTVDIFQAANGPAGNVIVDFIAWLTGAAGVVSASLGNTGVFAILPPNTPGTNIDFVFGPAVAPAPTTVPVPILTIGGFTFTATRLGPGNYPGMPFDLSESGGTVFATLEVAGTVTGPGLAAGGVRFTGGYTTQFASVTIPELVAEIEAGTVRPSTVSVTLTTTSAPEPTTSALLAAGLAALLGAARRRRTG